MATITKVPYKDGTFHWKARVRKHGKQKSRVFTHQSDAKNWAKKCEIELEKTSAGLIVPGSNKSLHQAIAKYRTTLLLEKRPETQRAYIRHLDYWDAELGHFKLSDINGERLSLCRDELTPGRAPATVNRYMATLASVLTATVKQWHWLPASPMLQTEKLTEHGQRKRFLSEKELAALLRECKASESPDLFIATMLAITTGARQGEILGLHWRDVDLKRQVITLHDTKNKDSRTLPIVDQVKPLLKARKKARKKARLKSKLVFPGKASVNAPINLRKSFTTAMARAGITDFRWHDLRHSAASFLAKDGASLLEIGELLGHRSANTTKRYAHLTEKHSHALARNMANRILPGKP